ncbi:uncharacterized protein EAE97_008101 [Botrytis byssoidea]|uniref:2EXR domain-containing protein n=1 Tax=Botrytis byssoidea TaxID=139641 RepID=A0A9P5I9E9_9HELO|nr:uncharacterized protein EAE97_008101 [Botrytis byssoidea]KAF7935194.1 hypothetical protein EAE97_008101 [Botrytis byssoidea]
MDGSNPPSWPPDNQNLTTPGAETAGYEFGRSTAVEGHRQQVAIPDYLPNNFPMGLTTEGYNQLRSVDTAPYSQFNRFQQLTTPHVNHLPRFSSFANGNTGMQGGSNQYTDGYAYPAFASSSSSDANRPLNTGLPQIAFTNQAGSPFYNDPRMAPSQSAVFSSPLNTRATQFTSINQGGKLYHPYSRMAPNRSARFNPRLRTSSPQLIFAGHERSSFYPEFGMTPNQPFISNPPPNTSLTQHVSTDQGSPFYPDNSIAQSQLAIFNPHPHMLPTLSGQLRTSIPLAAPDLSNYFSAFSSTPSEHFVNRNDPGQTSASGLVQMRVQDNRSSFGGSNETLISHSLSDNMQYASTSEMGQELRNMFSFDHTNANAEPDMSNWMADFMQNMPQEKTYVGRKHTGELYIGQTSTEQHRNGSATAYSNDCELVIKAFEISQTISNAIVDESDRQKLTRDAAFTWAQTFVPPGTSTHHEKQGKEYVSEKVYAYHPRGCKNYYYRSVVGNEVHIEHWVNNNTRTTVWNHPDNEFPSRIFDEYPADWSTNVDPNIELQNDSQKQKELNDLRSQICSSNNTSAKHRYKPADPDTRPSWQYHQGEAIITTDHGTVDVPRSSITRDSIMRVVSRVSNPIFTGAPRGGSFSFWDPNSRPPMERRRITHLSIKERRNILRRIRDLLERIWNLPSMPQELSIVYRMFLDCNSSPGFGQSQYLHARFATFPKFLKLPTELRWMIWEYCCLPKTEHLGLVVGTGDLRSEDHRIELPITLSICYESRKIAIHYYTIVDKPMIKRKSRYMYKGQITYDKRRKEYSQPRQLVLGQQDAVAISDSTPENRMEMTLEWHNKINEEHRKGLKSIRHLEIRDIRNNHGSYLVATRHLNSTADHSHLIPRVFTNGSLTMFKNLQTLTLTNMPPTTTWSGPQPFQREDQEILKSLISDHLDRTRVGDNRLVAKENIKIRDYTAMEGQKVKKDNGRVDFKKEFYSKMLTHLPEEYRN